MVRPGCLTCSGALGKFWRNGDNRGCQTPTAGTVGKADGSAGAQWDADSIQRATDIPSALQIYRRACIQAAKGTTWTSLREEQVQQLTDASCQLVEAVLHGIHDHVGQAIGPVDAEIRVLRQGKCAADAPQDLVSICVKFATSPILGEIATRSRVALSVLVHQEVTFTLQAPPCDVRGQPLWLRVEGLDIPALPEIGEIRSVLRNSLGSRLKPLTAYQWWKDNKDARYPLEGSKFHRVVESLTEQRGFKLLGTKLNADAFWGYLHTMDLNVACYEFHMEPRLKGGISILARLREPVSQDEATDRRIVKEITALALTQKRASGESLAPSGMNVAAMLSADQVGQPGAKVEVITKLFSAAEWWGPGDSGWHRLDHTWNCTDKRDMLHRLVKQQGRIIWRTAEHSADRTRDVEVEIVPAQRHDEEAGYSASLVGELVDVRAVALFFLSCAMALLLYSYSRYAGWFQ